MNEIVPSASPEFSVIVPTRDRPDHVVACVATVLQCSRRFELIVVDQSADQVTQVVLRAFVGDSRFHYVRSRTRGVSAARNIGVTFASAAIVVFTDDDCRVPRDWLECFGAVLGRQSDVVVVCGRVEAPAASELVGYAAQFAARARVYRTYPPPGEWGIAANMAVRRSAFERVGKFDELLGVGSSLRSAAEFDLLARVLRAGLAIANAPEPSVLHVGVRKHGTPSRELFRGYGIGIGAAFAKHARIGGPAEALLYLRWLAHLWGGAATRFVTMRRPTGLTLARGFVEGTIASLRYPIDRDTRRLRPSKEAAAELEGATATDPAA
jgi:glycosyltransferase involved in cell wall biosynthesis